MPPAPEACYLEAVPLTPDHPFMDRLSAALAGVYGDIAALLRNQYVLTLAAAGKADGRTARLRLVATIGGEPAATLAEFQRGSPPPPPPTLSLGPTAIVTPGVVPAAT